MKHLLYIKIICALICVIRCAKQEQWKRTASSVEEVLQVMNEGDERINLGNDKELIVLMGRTGTGKSTLIQFLAGDNTKLVAKHHPVRSNGFIIDDGNNRIGSNNILSKTLFPELTIDINTNKTFVDCPGFLDTRPYAMEIGASYFVKKILDFASSLKIIFTVAQTDTSSKGNFDDLLRSAVELMPDLDKLKDCIALIVTKVDGEKYSDEILVSDIRKYLKLVKEKIGGLRGSDYMVEKKKELIDAMLDTTNGGKIAIFRKPTKPGPLSQSETMQRNKAALRKVIYDSTLYLPTDDIQFNYTLSADTVKFIQENISEEIINSGLSQTTHISQDLTKHFKNLGSNSNNIFSFYNKSKIFAESLDENFNTQLTETSFLNILDLCFNVSTQEGAIFQGSRAETQSILKKHDFFKKFASRLQDPVNIWIKPLSKLLVYMKYLSNWYLVLTNIGKRIETIDVQQDKNRLIGPTFLSENVSIDLLNIDKVFLRVADSEILDANQLTKLSSSIYEQEKDGIETDNFILRDIQFIFKAMKRKLLCRDGNLFVESNFVSILADVIWALQNICKKSEKIRIIEIIAYEKIYIDANLKFNENEVHISIISPIWKVIEQKEINLNGASGFAHSVPLEKSVDSIGSNGVSGNPGEPGGSFLGIGHSYINGESLQILLDGGDGGTGQNGGDGADGIFAPYPELKPRFSNVRELVHYISDRGYILYRDVQNAESNLIQTGLYFVSLTAKQTMRIESKETGTDGYDGGHGGRGGVGAPSGQYRMLSLSNENPKFRISQKQGRIGPRGKGGKGGKAGRGPASIKISCKFNADDILSQSIAKTVECKGMEKLPMLLRSAGESGIDGVISAGFKVSRNPTYYDKSRIVSRYRVGSVQSDFIKPEVSSKFESLMQSEPDIINNISIHFIANEVLELDFNVEKTNISKLHKYFSSLIGYLSIYKNSVDLKTYQTVSKYLREAITSIVLRVQAKENFQSEITDFQLFLDSSLENVKNISRYHGAKLFEAMLHISKSSLDSNMINIGRFIETFTNTYFNKLKHNILTSTKESIQQINWQDFEIKETATSTDKQFENKNKELTFVTKIDVANETLLNSLRSIYTQHIRDLAVHELTVKFNKFFNFLGKISYVVGKTIDKTLKLMKLETDESYSNANVLQNIAEYAESITEKGEFATEIFTGENKRNLEDSFRTFVYPIVKSCIVKEKNDTTVDNEGESTPSTAIEYEDETDDSGVTQTSGIQDIPLTDIKKCLHELPQTDYSTKLAMTYLSYIENSDFISQIAQNLLLEYNTPSRDLTIPIIQIVNETSIYHSTVTKYSESFIVFITPIVESIDKDLKKYESQKLNKIDSLNVAQWNLKKIISKTTEFVQQLLRDLTIGKKYRSFYAQLKEISNIMQLIVNKVQYHVLLNSYLEKGNTAVEAYSVQPGVHMDAQIEIFYDIIKRNSLLLKYNEILNAYKRTTFPLAQIYLDGVQTSVKYTREVDSKSLAVKIENVITDIDKALKEKIPSIMVKRKKILKKGRFYSGQKVGAPFFVWNSNEYRWDIDEFLSGKETMFMADILRSGNKNAIKFFFIQLKILINHDYRATLDQSTLNAILASNFEIELTHMGNSRYKCDNKYFIINSESVTFSYSFDGTGPREPTTNNENYGKLLKDAINMSPYAMWRVKLVPLNDGAIYLLNDYKGKVDVTLEGGAYYVEAGHKLCSSNLEKYYDIYEPLNFE